MMKVFRVIQILLPILLFCGCAGRSRETIQKDSLDWKTVESHLDQYFDNRKEDKEVSFKKLEKAVLENASDELIGKIMVYSRNKRPYYSDNIEFGDRGDKIFWYGLGRLECSPECHKALKILESISKDLSLDAAYSQWYHETERELRARCAKTEK